jgi:hypothetical protein
MVSAYRKQFNLQFLVSGSFHHLQITLKTAVGTIVPVSDSLSSFQALLYATKINI